MPAPVFTRRLGGTAAHGPGAAVLFTADDARIYVLRDIVISSNVLVPANIQLFITFSGTQQAFLRHEPAWATLDPIHWEGRQVIEPGEQLFGFCDQDNWSALVTGWA